MRAIDKIIVAAAIFVLVIVIMSSLNLPSDVTNNVESWGLSIVIGIIFGALMGIIVDQIPGNWSKVIFLVIPIGGFKISVTLATIAIFVLQKILIKSM
jgi:hypothetical protein